MLAPLIETERLCLRPYKVDDFAKLLALYETDRAAFIGGRLSQRQVWDGFMNCVGQWPVLGLGGWAVDVAAPSGTGIDTIHVWAFPASGGAPTFAGVPALGGVRPDVGAFFGSQFTASGYNMLVSGLAPGTYDVVVYAHSSVTNAFAAAQVVRVTVR